MPEMDGLEAIKEIRKTNRMPIVVQSAYSMPEDRNLSFKAGANDFISKPIGTEKLLRIIDKHLNEYYNSLLPYRNLKKGNHLRFPFFVLFQQVYLLVGERGFLQHKLLYME